MTVEDKYPDLVATVFDQVREHPCVHGHFDCATYERGPCAGDTLDSLIRKRDAESITDGRTDAQYRTMLAAAAIEWVTDDRDPSTRDLLTLEGLKHADWIEDTWEVQGIVRSVVGNYGSLDAYRAFLSLHGIPETKEER